MEQTALQNLFIERQPQMATMAEAKADNSIQVIQMDFRNQTT